MAQDQFVRSHLRLTHLTGAAEIPKPEVLPDLEVPGVVRYSEEDGVIQRTARRQLLEKHQQEQQVIVHCTYTNTLNPDQIDVWPETVLHAHECRSYSKMIAAYNIPVTPKGKKLVDTGTTAEFTLVFEGLPKDCTTFDLLELHPEPIQFVVLNIERNLSDVYRVEIGPI